jgi:membrane-bound ClpP family serine protease
VDIILPVVLLIVGFGLVIFEVFIPSFGLLTLCAMSSFAVSALLAFDYSKTFGFGIIGSAVIGVPVFMMCALKILPKTSFGKRIILQGPEGPSHAVTRDLENLFVGKTGTATSNLRPAGVADIDGERCDVVTRGEMLPRGARIEVIESSGNRLVVRSIDTVSDNQEPEVIG